MFILDLASHTPGAVTANCMRRAVGSVLRRAIDDEEREKEQQAAQDREAKEAKDKATVAEIVAMGYGLGVVEVAVKLSHIDPNGFGGGSWPAMPVTGKAPIYVGATYPTRAVEGTPSIEEVRASDPKYGGSRAPNPKYVGSVAPYSSSSDSGGDSSGGGSSGSSSALPHAGSFTCTYPNGCPHNRSDGNDRTQLHWSCCGAPTQGEPCTGADRRATPFDGGGVGGGDFSFGAPNNAPPLFNGVQGTCGN